MRLGVDIGGTFTDLLLIDETTGHTEIVKVLTTPDEPSDAVMLAVSQAFERANKPIEEVDVVVHGTTLATNTIIERKGALTALLATQGHQDTVEIRREHRYVMYDVLVEAPKSLAPRHLRFGIDERLSADGKVLNSLNRDEAERLLSRLEARGIQAIAVSFLHSYRNPIHELAIREIAEKVAPSVNVTLSSEVAPEIKEFERTSTTLCNAYIVARVDAYLGHLEARFQEQGFKGAFFMMQSSGGLCSVDVARAFPVRILESGPAGGALAASFVGGVADVPDLLSFDMGGTTAKLAVIDKGQPLVSPELEVDRVYRFAEGSGLPVRIPTIEMIEIGAGGGSVAGVDNMGLLQVGPESASSVPGPACYGRGGRLPTVTDADLILGYLNANYFLGGQITLDCEAAQAALARHVAEPLGLDVIEAAYGIHRIVNENMANAARVHLTERGKDPAQYPLFAFGGAGPVHAFGVAAAIGSPSFIVPYGAGVMSALGFLAAPLSFEFVQSWYGLLSDLDWDRLNERLILMEDEGQHILGQAGVRSEDMRVFRWCDMRYHRQGFEVKVPIPAGQLTNNLLSEMRDGFEDRYQQLYGRTVPNVELEVLNWRVIVEGPRPELNIAANHMDAKSGEARKGVRPAYFPEAGGFVETPVFDRYGLSEGSIIVGPAIVEERESTVVIGPQATGTVDEMLNLIVQLK